MFRKVAILMGVAVLLAGVAPQAQAQIQINLPVPGGNTTITGFDLLAGNAAFGALPGTAVGSTVTTNAFFQTSVASFLPAANTPPGINATYELTVAAVIPTTLTTIAPGVVSININAGGAFALLFDAPADANANLGTGFVDGTVIASGVFVPTGASVIPGTPVTIPGFVQASPVVQPLGGADNDPRPTLTANGSVQFVVDITSFNSTFFPTGISGLVLDAAFGSTELVAPFTVADTLAGGQAFFGGAQAAGLPGALTTPFTPNIGAVNLLSGPNALVQSDATVTLVGTSDIIPEPSTYVLSAIGAGLLGLFGFVRSRRRAIK